mmetsp:Transcript_79971/g.239560  ORF Transcript_79971/g.239560 Transcript_79971/m.239560 type:complete len:219 (-) Transcript_79971:742-1398(-)
MLPSTYTLVSDTSSSSAFFLFPSLRQASSKIASTCLLMPRLSESRERLGSRKTSRGPFVASSSSSGCNSLSALTMGWKRSTPEYFSSQVSGTDVRKIGPRGCFIVLAISRNTGMRVAEMLIISCTPWYELVVRASLSIDSSSRRCRSWVRSIESASSLKRMKRPLSVPDRCKSDRMEYTLPRASVICDAVSDMTMQSLFSSVILRVSAVSPVPAYAMH